MLSLGVVRILYYILITSVLQYALHGNPYYLKKIPRLLRLFIIALLIAITFGSVFFLFENVKLSELLTLYLFNAIIVVVIAVVRAIRAIQEAKRKMRMMTLNHLHEQKKV